MNVFTILKAVNMKKGLPAVITGVSTFIALGIAFRKAVKECRADDTPIIEGTCTTYDDMDNKEEFDENVNEIHNEDDEVDDEEIKEMAEDAAK